MQGWEVQSDGRSGEEKGLERWGAAGRMNGLMVMFLVLEGLPKGLEGSRPRSLLPGRLCPQGSLSLAGRPAPPYSFLQDRPVHPSRPGSISTSSRKFPLNSSMDNNVPLSLLLQVLLCSICSAQPSHQLAAVTRWSKHFGGSRYPHSGPCSSERKTPLAP